MQEEQYALENGTVQPTALYPHFTPLGFPPQVNNKALVLSDEERKILNFAPKFVPANPKQALERLDKEISVMKEKIAEAWRRETKTVAQKPKIVEKFAETLENEIRKLFFKKIQRIKTSKKH